MAQRAGDEIELDLRDPVGHRRDRLAELVAELTDCEPAGALHALRSLSPDRSPDTLELVAQAMVHVDRPVPEGFRVTGFLRRDLVPERAPVPAPTRRLPHRVHGGLPHRRPMGHCA